MDYFRGLDNGRDGVSPFFIPKADRANPEFVKGHNQGVLDRMLGGSSTSNIANGDKSNDYVLDTLPAAGGDIYGWPTFFAWILGILLLFSGHKIIIFIGIFLFCGAYIVSFLGDSFVEMIIELFTALFSGIIIPVISFIFMSIINISRLIFYLTKIWYFSSLKNK